jgi:hypothetical protein
MIPNTLAPTLPQLLDDVCNSLELSIENVISSSRKFKFKTARFIFSYIAFYFTNYSLKEIGKSIGNRDHSTVLVARDVAENLILNKDAKFYPFWEKYLLNSQYYKTISATKQIHKKNNTDESRRKRTSRSIIGLG